MPATRAVLFDANGVLYDRAVETGHVFRELLAERGSRPELSPEASRERDALKHDASVGRVSAEAYWDRYLALAGVASPADRVALVARMVGAADDVRALPGTRPTLAELRRRGLRLGVVTDTMYGLERKRRWLARIGVLDLVDAIACSTEIGVTKPDPRIYRAALDTLGVAADEALFVGHAAHELEGARSVGMATAAVGDEPAAHADHRLITLAGVLDLPGLASTPIL